MKNRKKKEGQARKLAAAAAAAAAEGGGGPAAPAPPAEESELCSEGGAVGQTGAVGVEVCSPVRAQEGVYCRTRVTTRA